MHRVAANGLTQRTCERLEYTFNLVMLVGALGAHKEIHPGSVAKLLEKMEKHLGRHIADFLAMEFRIPHNPRTSAKIKRDST